MKRLFGGGHFTGWPLSRQHGNNFDVIRLVLAIAVIFNHSYPLASGAASTPDIWLYWLSGTTLSLGNLAVFSFFSISGLLVANSLEHSRNAGHFLLKRVFRIYPAFAVTYIISVFVVGLIGADDPSAYLNSVLTPMTVAYGLMLGAVTSPLSFVHVPFPYAINGSLWTIWYEFLCYLTLAILWLLVRRWFRLSISVLFASLLILLYLHQTQIYRLSDTPLKLGELFLGQLSAWIQFAPYFLGGVVFYAFRHSIPKSRWLAVAVLGVLLIGRSPGLILVVLPVCLPYFLFHLAFSNTIRVHWWARRVGDLSYGTYLWGFAVQQLLVLLVNLHDPMTLAVSATAVSLVIASLSWRYVEAPAILAPGRLSSSSRGGRAPVASVEAPVLGAIEASTSS